MNGFATGATLAELREDLSDLGTMLDWAEAHPAEACRIARAAREYAHTHLRRRHAIEFLAGELLRLSGST